MNFWCRQETTTSTSHTVVCFSGWECSEAVENLCRPASYSQADCDLFKGCAWLVLLARLRKRFFVCVNRLFRNTKRRSYIAPGESKKKERILQEKGESCMTLSPPFSSLDSEDMKLKILD